MTEFALSGVAWGCTLFALLAALLHLSSALLTAYRHHRKKPDAPSTGLPRITVLRPVRGLDPYDEATLRSGFELDYPSYELILCCADADDPVVPVIRRLMREHPHVEAKLLIGRDDVSSNPKLNNLVKGWRIAASDWVVMADSNVLMPKDYLQRLLMTWGGDTGLVCAPPLGSRPHGFWAEVECAFLNTYQARWQYAADTVGLGFAQGKTMLWRRADLEQGGGITALGAEIAEDAASTKLVRRSGLRVRLADRAFEQPLGPRTALQVWSRQSRWAKLRRATFPLCFLPEIFTGSLAPLLAAGYAAYDADVSIIAIVGALGLFWYGVEALLARAVGWHFTPMSAAACLTRDLVLPAVWTGAWLSNEFSWRGNDMRLADATAGH